MNTRIRSAVLVMSLLVGTIAQAASSQKLVTIVTSPDAQTQLMAMVLTFQAVRQGAQAHILLCGPAGDMALKDAPESVLAPQKPKGMSPQGLMAMILEKSATTAEVCAIYLPNANLQPDALIDGITAADPEAMAGRLLADGTRIMSF